MEFEKRALMTAPEFRADGDKMTLKGYAAVFDSLTRIGGYFDERIARGAFKSSLDNDVRALIDHDHGRVIGRTKSGTLRMAEDDKGLAVEIDLPDTTDGRDLRELVGRGDIDGMSFGFRVTKEEWDETQEPAVRTIHEVELFEVSAVTFPAYPDTSIALRSRDEAKKEPEKKEHDRKGYAERKAEQEQKFRGIN